MSIALLLSSELYICCEFFYIKVLYLCYLHYLMWQTNSYLKEDSVIADFSLFSLLLLVYYLSGVTEDCPFVLDARGIYDSWTADSIAEASFKVQQLGLLIMETGDRY